MAIRIVKKARIANGINTLLGRGRGCGERGAPRPVAVVGTGVGAGVGGTTGAFLWISYSALDWAGVDGNGEENGFLEEIVRFVKLALGFRHAFVFIRRHIVTEN